MGVVSAILKFYDVDWRMAEWAASNEPNGPACSCTWS